MTNLSCRVVKRKELILTGPCNIHWKCKKWLQWPIALSIHIWACRLCSEIDLNKDMNLPFKTNNNWRQITKVFFSFLLLFFFFINILESFPMVIESCFLSAVCFNKQTASVQTHFFPQYHQSKVVMQAPVAEGIFTERENPNSIVRRSKDVVRLRKCTKRKGCLTATWSAKTV